MITTLATVDPMFSPLKGAARINIDHLTPADIARLQRAGTIVADSTRRRPRYFDGRFLAAPDLQREQDYFITRQADLARASVSGVVHGLTVTGTGDTTLQIAPGSGVTPAGELVVLQNPLTVDLGDVATMQNLESAFGLDGIPNQPPRRRSGLFVLALRPVEFTANPIAAYPTSISQQRTVDDGDVVEAVAVTLVPYPDDQAELDPQRRRAYAARKIFVDDAAGGVPAETLPLAMIELDGGFIDWIDPYLVRREVGAEHGGVSGFGPVPRAVREAQVLQYLAQLEDVIAARAAAGAGPPRMAAAETFRALPAVGKLPIEAIDRLGVMSYTQLYFPPQMPVLMALVPEDELAAQIDEGLLLPPIDLTASSDELGFTFALVILPAPRASLFVDNLTRAVALVPATPDVATRSLSLSALTRFFPLTPPPPPASPAATARATANEQVLLNTFTALHSAGTRLWYVRRRALRIKPERRYQVHSIEVGKR